MDQYGCAQDICVPDTVGEVSESNRERGHAIPQIPQWWTDLAIRLMTTDSQRRPLRVLGADLAKRIGRRLPFQQSTLSHFKAGTGGVTYELIQALCAEFDGLPAPIVFPASYEEALEIRQIVERNRRTVGGAEVVVPIDDGRRHRKRASSPSTGTHSPSRIVHRSRTPR